MIYFEIHVDDIERAKRFYADLFGWKFTRVDWAPIEYWEIETSAGERGGMLKRPISAPPMQSGSNAFICSFEVADFDTTAALITAKGGIVALEKMAVPGKCWQGYFLDTESNTFGIFQPDPDAR